jgi:hypothetical protein
VVAVALLAALAAADPPVKGRPDDFVGAVGRFALSADVRPSRFRLDETVWLVVELKGIGDLSKARAPDLSGSASFTAGFDVVGPPKRSAEPNVVRFEYPIRARSSSARSVPGIRLSIYDDAPPRPSYRLLRTAEIPIEVLPAGAGDVITATAVPNDGDASWSIRSTTPFVVVAAVIAAAGMTIWLRLRRFRNADATGGPREAKRRERRQRPFERPVAFRRADAARWFDRFGDALRLPSGRRTPMEIAVAAQRVGLDEALAASLRRNLSLIDEGRFAAARPTVLDEGAFDVALTRIQALEATKRSSGDPVNAPP